MKHLKIFATVLFFCFLGSVQSQVLAQEPTKNIGYWGRVLKFDEYLENGEYRAKLDVDRLIIYRKDNGNVITSVVLSSDNYAGYKIWTIKIESEESAGMTLACNRDTWYPLRKNIRGNFRFFKVLDKDTEVSSSAYFQLESDGRFVIYDGTTFFGGAGTPIIEITNNK